MINVRMMELILSKTIYPSYINKPISNKNFEFKKGVGSTSGHCYKK